MGDIPTNMFGETLSDEKNTVVPGLYAKAAVAILNKLYDEEPDHPGIAHYIIHSCDNPSMASLALPAARKYATIAPASAHAVHMPSHIFARLGLWQDDINSNLAAIKIADQMSSMHMHVMHHKIHSLDFLEYAYLQIGDDASAKSTAEAIAAFPQSAADPEFEDYLQVRKAMAPAMYALERRQWKEALSLQPLPNTPPYVQIVTYWAHAIAAGHLHDAAAADDAMKHYDQLLEATRKSDKPTSRTRSRKNATSCKHGPTMRLEIQPRRLAFFAPLRILKTKSARAKPLCRLVKCLRTCYST